MHFKCSLTYHDKNMWMFRTGHAFFPFPCAKLKLDGVNSKDRSSEQFRQTYVTTEWWRVTMFEVMNYLTIDKSTGVFWKNIQAAEYPRKNRLRLDAWRWAWCVSGRFEGPFSAVSRPILATRYAFCSLCTLFAIQLCTRFTAVSTSIVTT